MRRFASLVLAAALGTAAATSAVFGHDLWLRPASFQLLTDEVLAVSVEVGDGFVGDPLPFGEELFEHLEAVAPDGRIVSLRSIEGVHPAGFLKPDRAGRWTLGFKGRPWLQRMSPDSFDRYLAELGRLDLLVQRSEMTDIESSAQIVERVHRCARSEIEVHPSQIVTRAQRSDGPPQEQPALDCQLDLEPQSDLETSRIESSKERRFRLIWRGKPLPAARVMVWPPRSGEGTSRPTRARVFETDEHGELTLPTDRDGTWLVTSVLLQPTDRDDPAAAWQSFWISFTFESAATTQSTRKEMPERSERVPSTHLPSALDPSHPREHRD